MGIYCLACKFWVIVLLTEVTEPYTFEILMEVGGECFCRLGVGKVSVARTDTLLENLRVASLLQHFAVVVCLNDEVVTEAYVLVHVVSDCTYVSHHGERCVFRLDVVAYVLGCVVRKDERCYLEWAYLELLVRNNLDGVFCIHLVLDLIIAVDSLVYKCCGIHWYMIFIAQKTCVLDVVGMVVSDEYTADDGCVESVLTHILFKTPNAHACIYEDGVGSSTYVIAVATTATSETEECEH